MVTPERNSTILIEARANHRDHCYNSDLGIDLGEIMNRTEEMKRE